MRYGVSINIPVFDGVVLNYGKDLRTKCDTHKMIDSFTRSRSKTVKFIDFLSCCPYSLQLCTRVFHNLQTATNFCNLYCNIFLFSHKEQHDCTCSYRTAVSTLYILTITRHTFHIFQRAKLLDNSERLERSGKRLDDGYRTCIESEQIGTQILEDLHSQRQTIQRSRDRVSLACFTSFLLSVQVIFTVFCFQLRETNENLGKSSRVLSGMTRR